MPAQRGGYSRSIHHVDEWGAGIGAGATQEIVAFCAGWQVGVFDELSYQYWHDDEGERACEIGQFGEIAGVFGVGGTAQVGGEGEVWGDGPTEYGGV